MPEHSDLIAMNELRIKSLSYLLLYNKSHVKSNGCQTEWDHAKFCPDSSVLVKDHGLRASLSRVPVSLSSASQIMQIIHNVLSLCSKDNIHVDLPIRKFDFFFLSWFSLLNIQTVSRNRGLWGTAFSLNSICNHSLHEISCNQILVIVCYNGPNVTQEALSVYHIPSYVQRTVMSLLRRSNLLIWCECMVK